MMIMMTMMMIVVCCARDDLFACKHNEGVRVVCMCLVLHSLMAFAMSCRAAIFLAIMQSPIPAC